MKVVHVKRDASDVYIGRKVGNLGIWGNPFRIGDILAAPKKGSSLTVDIPIDRPKAIELYENYIRKRLNQDRKLRDLLISMKDARLGCWCAPQPCHGDILIKLNKELIDNNGELLPRPEHKS